jgi:hypothetical protein
MPVPCELVPRHDVTPEQMKELGAALREWCRREFGDGVLYSIDQKALASLLGGEPPDPLALQAKSHHPDVPLGRIREDMGALAGFRSVRFAVKDEPQCTRAQVIESLRQAIPADLVDDIFIDNVSWSE